jgi:hypothetical protein
MDKERKDDFNDQVLFPLDTNHRSANVNLPTETSNSPTNATPHA